MRRLLLCWLLATLTTGAWAGAAGARTVTPLPDDWQKGANVTAFRWDELSGKRARSWIVRLKRSARAEQATFVTRWFQYWGDGLRGDHLTATEIHPAWGDAARCRRAARSDWTSCQTPGLAETERALRYARRQGLRVSLKPLLDVGRSARASFPRERIDFEEPVQRRAWFDAYKFMLSQYARMARDVGADTLVVGTGLAGMADDPGDVAEWRAIIRQIRSGELMGDGRGGFRGALTYAARWDEVYADARDPEHRFAWDELDAIGVEGFWPLVSAKGGGHDDPSVSRLREGWTFNFLAGGMPPAAALRALHLEYGRPVLLTGLGYLSRGGTAAAPHKSDAEQAAAGGRWNLRAQQRPYRAAFDFWSKVARQGWFRGIWWWHWHAGASGSPRNGDFSPQGKPAEVELCLRHAGRMDRSCRASRRAPR